MPDNCRGLSRHDNELHLRCFDGSRRHGYEEFQDVCCTVESFWGTGGGNVPLILEIHEDSSDRDRPLQPKHNGGGGKDIELNTE